MSDGADIVGMLIVTAVYIGFLFDAVGYEYSVVTIMAVGVASLMAYAGGDL